MGLVGVSQYTMRVAGVSARSTFFSSRMSTKVNWRPSPT